MPNKLGKGYKGIGMEGLIASWYAKVTAPDLDEFRQIARRLSQQLSPSARVLEIAPGPGYLAVELAKLGFSVTGLDISRSFVRIASDNARKAGVRIEFWQGDAANMPLGDDQFDFVVCRAAFKNFTRPLDAINEMHRVLKDGGTALIIDLRKDFSQQGVDDYARGRGKGWLDATIMKMVFNTILKKRAYTTEAVTQMASDSKFRHGDLQIDTIGFELWLKK
jgi:ubiquinone/menaquinone biosynthesis C-methylase UbiE